MVKRVIWLKLVLIVIAGCAFGMLNIPSVSAQSIGGEIISTAENAAGTIIGEGEYSEGDEVDLSADLNAGWIFGGWYHVGEMGEESLITDATTFSGQITSKGTVYARYEQAGIVTGEGYYTLGSTAVVSVIPNAGWQFEGLIGIDGDGNEYDLGVLPDYRIEESDGEYIASFTVTRNMLIKCKFNRIEYSVELDEQAQIDFDMEVTNESVENGNIYYNHQVKIKVSAKTGETGRYIYNLFNSNISINGTTISDILSGANEMALSCSIKSDKGFDHFELTLNVQDDITISIDYDYMYKFSLSSANGEPIEDIIKFANIVNYNYMLDAYTFLLCEQQSIMVNLSEGDDVYEFKYSSFDGVNNTEYSRSYTLTEDGELKICYEKKQYAVTFATYVQNDHGNYDKQGVDLYSLASIGLVAGEQTVITYDDYSKSIIVDGLENIRNPLVFGYIVVGFAVNGKYEDISKNLTFTMDAEAPSNVEIQILLQCIQYKMQIQLVDEYFAPMVQHEILFNTDKLNVGTIVTLNADTDYEIKGWSEVARPMESDYKSRNATYSFTFVPDSDDSEKEYVMYLDVDYTYRTSTFELNPSSIVENVEYDTVIVDDVNNAIEFIDSYNILPTQQIIYTATDVEDDGITKKIDTRTSKFGVVCIVNNQLTYGNGNQYSSIGIDEEGKKKYTFDKYTYMADLQISIIKHLTLTENNTNVYLNVFGDSYGEEGISKDTLLQSVITQKIYRNDMLAYKLTYFYDDLYLYIGDSGEYKYILFRGVKFYYNETTRQFEIVAAQINTPDEIDVQITRDSKYEMRVNNLIPDNLLVYGSTASSDLYGFSGHWQGNVTLFSFINSYTGNNETILRGAESSGVVALYTRLAKDVHLQITDRNAYSDENITYVCGGNIGTGNVITAVIDTSITVNLDVNKIAKGYKFDGFRLSGADEYLDSDYSFEFIMNSTYAGSIIELCFSPIKYILKLNYLDAGNVVVDYSTLNGVVTFKSQDYINSSIANGSSAYIGDTLDVTRVAINGIYEFKAISNAGYYLSDAYVGSKAYTLDSLINTNESQTNETYWTLSEEKFLEAVINNANKANEVQLYIQFIARSYSVKVYFEISSSANSITYPDVIYNGITYKVDLVEESCTINGVEQLVGKYVCIINEVYYGDLANIAIDASSLMVGVAFQEWRDSDNKLIGSALPTNIFIDGNKAYTAILQYIRYDVKFMVVDMEEKECSYGIGKFEGASSFVLNDNVYYTATASNGYVLVDMYYYDNAKTKQSEGIGSGFIFEPSKYFIENRIFRIYLQFDLKRVSLSINNTKSQDSASTLSTPPSGWAELTVLRQRNGEMLTLNSEDEYVFQTGDVLTLISKPITLGIELLYAQLVDSDSVVDISNSSTTPYSLRCIEIIEGGLVIALQYRLEMVFNNSMISTLDSTAELNNIFRVKKYEVNYTYNLIEKKCGVKLAVNYNGLSIQAPDTPYTAQIDYASKIKFGYDSSTISEKFSLLGYELNGVWDKNNGNVQFSMESEDLWQEIATNRYNAKSNQIIIKLKLGPKITLKNTDSNNPYKYTRVYNAQTQKLVLGEDIIVADEFNVRVTYNDSYAYPKDSGTYYVNVSVDEGDGVWIDFEETITFVILPATISLTSLYNYDRPLSKVYDGTNSVNIENLLDGLVLNGVYTQYGDSISIDSTQGLVAHYQKSVASERERYNITIYNVYIVDNLTRRQPTNYVLEDGTTTFILNRSGKITARSLIITGFKIDNKVYDGTGDVQVDLRGITYNGVIATDSANIITQNLRFYCEDFSIGYDREVFLDFSKALTGSDSTNYNVSYNPTYIDIHPYELTMNINDYGEFKVVDLDKKCLIPIDTTLKINIYDTNTSKYRELYPMVETHMASGEKFRVVYDVKLQAGVTTLDLPAGTYLYMPEMKKISKVVLVNGENSDVTQHEIAHGENAGMVVIKVGEAPAMVCLLSQTVYMPLWLILLIILGCIIVVGILILIFVLIRRKKKQKYRANDRI